jgi:hypothetical protein
MNIFGPPNIEKLRKNRNVKKLIKALDYEQPPAIRAGAAKALGELNDSPAHCESDHCF